MFDIPIVINNFNRLYSLRRMVNDLKSLGYDNLHIIDNASSYPKLLEYYEKECPCKVIRLDSNQGHLAIYNSNYIEEFQVKYPFIAYTDPDLEINRLCPKNFIEILVKAAESNNKMKAGVALRIDDLPQNAYASWYRDWESKFWWNRIGEIEGNDVYDAVVDSTFCIINPGLAFDYQAVRVAGNLTMRHLPWYTNFDRLDEEELYFLENSLEHVSSYKRFYLREKNNK